MSDRPHLIVPVETAARELDAKLLLSLFAVNNGMDVTIGNKALLNLRIGGLRPGVYLSHNFNAGRDRIISLARRLGHTVAAWDEEGLVWINEEIYRRRRASAAAMARLDLLFLWGKEQARALQPVTAQLRTKVSVSGNPRADLLRPELRSLYSGRVEALRAELGDFILINSNFGWINHALAKSRHGPVEEHLRNVAAKSGFPLAYLQHRYAIYRAFTSVIPRIAARFPLRRIVVRPHPSENRDGWTAEVGDLPNVIVRYDHDLVPWLLSAKHIVQNGCTTAVETAMLGRAAISFRPLIVPEHEIPQPHRVSHIAQSEDELMALLADQNLTDAVPDAFCGALDDMVEGLRGPLASARIADEMSNILKSNRAQPGTVRRIGAKGAALFRRMEKSVLRHVPGSASRPHYVSQKFPSLPATEIAARLSRFASLLSLPEPDVRQISDRIFTIRPASSRN
jgi:surface carbohydrate biosynthesis protein